jgi:1,2-diacylglycerol 3-alpha-glucosyltransferase
MRVAILVPNFSEYDGAARVAELQAEELAEEGNYVAVFAFAADIQPKRADLFIMGMPGNLFWQRVYRLLFPLDLLKTIKWLPKLKSYDEVIVHLYPLTWLGYLARKVYKVKYTFWYHGVMDPKFFPRLYERVYIRAQIFLTRLTLRNVDRAVAVSKYGQRELKRYTGLDSEVIWNQVDSTKFHPGIDGTWVRDKHKLADAPVILSVGALRPVKGFHLLIRAFHLIKQSMPSVRMVIVGRPDYKYYADELKKAGDDSVIFIDHLPHDVLPFYYAMCDIYATCSLWETFSLPLFEAQACGKSVVAFDIGAFADNEAVNETCRLVKLGDVDAFAQACIDRLRQVRQGI